MIRRRLLFPSQSDVSVLGGKLGIQRSNLGDYCPSTRRYDMNEVIRFNIGRRYLIPRYKGRNIVEFIERDGKHRIYLLMTSHFINFAT
jgi:hypothetical protein